MIKNFLLAILFLPLFGLSQSNVTASATADETAIRKILDEQTKAWNRGDLEEFMQGYWNNDSLMFIGKSGIDWGWEKTLAGYKKRYAEKQQWGR